MKLYIFKDGTGALVGYDNYSIVSNVSGVLHVGDQHVALCADKSIKLPLFKDGCCQLLFEGSALGFVKIKNGRIIPRDGLSELECKLILRVETLETETAELRAECERLSNVFDTNSLNFLIDSETDTTVAEYTETESTEADTFELVESSADAVLEIDEPEAQPENCGGEPDIDDTEETTENDTASPEESEQTNINTEKEEDI